MTFRRTVAVPAILHVFSILPKLQPLHTCLAVRLASPDDSSSAGSFKIATEYFDMRFSTEIFRPQSPSPLSSGSNSSSDCSSSEASFNSPRILSPETVDMPFKRDSADTQETTLPLFDVSQLRSNSRDTIDLAIKEIIPGTSPERFCREIVIILETKALPYSVDQIVESYANRLDPKPSAPPVHLSVFTQAVANIIGENLGLHPFTPLAADRDIESQEPIHELDSAMPSYWENRREVLGSPEMVLLASLMGLVSVGTMMFDALRPDRPNDGPQESVFSFMLFHLATQFLATGIRAAVVSRYALRSTKIEAVADMVRFGLSPVGTGLSDLMLLALSERQHAAGTRVSKWEQSAYVLGVSAMGSLCFIDGWYFKAPVDSANKWFNNTVD